MEQINLRTSLLKEEDYENLSIFFRENDALEITNFFNPFLLTKEKAYELTHKKSLDKYYVAYLDGAIVGFSMLRGWEEGFKIPSLGIFVHKNYWRRGIGRKLVNYTIKQAEELSCDKIRITVYSENKGALKLYESIGFKKQKIEVRGDRKKWVMFKNLKHQ
jgi:ribosomal protein S18 acetylase RimI-like enzyme